MPRSFQPENTEDKLYINGHYGLSLSELLAQTQAHFKLTDGEADSPEVLSKFTISAEHIHTDCIGYDQYDSSDWTNFIVIERHK